MKKFTYTILVLLLCLASSAVFANVVVSDITTPADMNGVYVEQTALHEGKPFYIHIDNPNYCIYFSPGMGTDGNWYISNSLPLTMPMVNYSFYKNTDGTINTPPASGYTQIGSAVGNPAVADSPVIPISMWAIVFIFFITGAFIVYRSYKKRQIA